MGRAETQAVMDELQWVAEFALTCECGADWKGFFFAGVPGEGYIGGCKRCGRIYVYKGEAWELRTGPPAPPEESASAG